MPRTLTPTELRRDVYRILDEVLRTGRPRQVVRDGKSVLLVPLGAPRFDWDELPRRHATDLSAEELAEVSWEGEWSGEG